MAERNANVLEEKRIELRIGVNLGDIIIDSEDIFGNGVNVAVRLEGIADPGGICASERVKEYAQDQLEVSFEDAGEHQLKNIAAGLSGLHSTAACISTIKVLVPLRRPEDFARWAEGELYLLFRR